MEGDNIMHFEVIEGNKYQQVLLAEITVEEMEPFWVSASQRLAKSIDIPGFRKGKAPYEIIQRFLGMDAILREASAEILAKTYAIGIEEKNITPCCQPSIEILNYSGEESLRYKATVTVKPIVKLGQYLELKMKRIVQGVSETDIDKAISEQRERMTQLVEAPPDAVAKYGDVLSIDFFGTKNGVAFKGGNKKDYPLVLGQGRLIPGFEEQLVGCKCGEHKTVYVTFPMDYPDKNMAGCDVVFSVTIKEINYTVQPELDQDFIDEVSEEATTMEGLRKEVYKRLLERNREKANLDVRNAIVEKAVQNAEVDIPPALIEEALNGLLDQFEDRLAEKHITMEKYLENAGITIEQLREKYRDKAKELAKRDLTLEAIIRAEDIQIQKAELDRELILFGMNYYQPLDKIRKELEESGHMKDFIYNLKLNKVLDKMFDSALIQEEIIDLK